MLSDQCNNSAPGPGGGLTWGMCNEVAGMQAAMASALLPMQGSRECYLVGTPSKAGRGSSRAMIVREAQPTIQLNGIQAPNSPQLLLKSASFHGQRKAWEGFIMRVHGKSLSH